MEIDNNYVQQLKEEDIKKFVSSLNVKLVDLYLNKDNYWVVELIIKSKNKNGKEILAEMPVVYILTDKGVEQGYTLLPQLQKNYLPIITKQWKAFLSATASTNTETTNTPSIN